MSSTTLTNNDNPLDPNILALPYPAHTKTAQVHIQSTPTIAQLTTFSDKLLLTVSQHGKLAQWFSVPLGLDNPSLGDGYMSLDGAMGGGMDGGVDGEDGDDDGVAGLLTPQNRFHARTMLGGGGGEREVWGGLVARCVAGLIIGRAKAGGSGGEEVESRTLVVGLGLVGVRFDGDVDGGGGGDGGEMERREVFLRVLELVSRVL